MLSIHPRSDWLDPDFPWDGIIIPRTGKTYYCGKRTNLSLCKEIVVHYPGADWSSMDLNKDGKINKDDTIHVIRQMHKMYMMDPNRGYSFGYCFVVGQEGEVWQGRGLDYVNAANPGDEAHKSIGWNTWSVSILVVVDVDQAANELQLKAINDLIEYLCAVVPSINSLVWHGVRQYTACAGEIIPQIQAGQIYLPWNAPKPEPEPEPEPPESEDMKVIRNLNDADGITCLANGQIKTWLDNGHASAAALDRCGQENPIDVDETTFASYGPIIGPIPAGYDAYGRRK